jgi:Skp family chaperone for outer membrane proteins
MALCHYGRQVRKHWKAALQKQAIADAALSKERKIRKKLQSEQAELQKKIETLQKAEAQLKKWEDRKPIISHYMDAFCEMSK